MVCKNIYFLLTGAEDYKYNRAKKLLKLLGKKNNFEEDLIIISGFSALEPYQNISEAKKYKNYLEENSSNLPKIILEEKAMDTLGNMVFSYEIVKKILDKEKQKINLFLITEDFHMRRSKWLFKQVFLDLKENLNVKFISVYTLSFQKIIATILLIFCIFLFPLIWLFKFTFMNRYIKDLIILQIIKKDFNYLELDTYKKIQDFTYSLSVYENQKNKIKVDLKKSIYSKALDYTRK